MNGNSDCEESGLLRKVDIGVEGWMENTDEEEGEKVVNKGVVEKVVEPGGKVFNIVTVVDIVVKLTALGIEQDVETT